MPERSPELNKRRLESLFGFPRRKKVCGSRSYAVMQKQEMFSSVNVVQQQNGTVKTVIAHLGASTRLWSKVNGLRSAERKPWSV